MNASAPPPIDLRDLHLIRTVASRGSLTRAAAEVGLTQSALTRQIQAIETRLGFMLFARTTRRVEPTAAARQLLEETASLSAGFAATLRRLRESCAAAPRDVRIGLSRSVALAHLPGLLHAHRRRAPDVRTTVAHLDQAPLLAAVQDGTLDLGILGTPRPMPPALKIAHRMSDAFVLIGNAAAVPPGRSQASRRWSAALCDWLNRQPWLHFTPRSGTGSALQNWLETRGLRPQSAAEVDNFDMIVHLAALGFGIGLVPRRTLAGFPRRSHVRVIPLPESFSRELVVVTRRSPGAVAPQVRAFIDSILFS